MAAPIYYTSVPLTSWMLSSFHYHGAIRYNYPTKVYQINPFISNQEVPQLIDI